jgi:hypothetical protein
MTNAKSNWLLVERLSNWQIDQLDEFSQFGIPRAQEKLGKQIKKGDLLIFYVSSGISSFADVRQAREDGLSSLGPEGHYDEAYPWRVATKPVLTLPQERWVPIKTLFSKLSFIAEPGWQQCMRQSVRMLRASDASVILEAMRRAHEQK